MTKAENWAGLISIIEISRNRRRISSYKLFLVRFFVKLIL